VTSTSWEHQREVRDALRTIVSDPQLGVPALSSAQTMSNLLKDLLPDAPRETSVLVAAAEAGLAQVLLDHVSQGMDIATASSLTASAFAARTPFTADACNWAVAELSVALGLAPGAPAGGSPVGPPPAGFPQAGVARTAADPGGPAGQNPPPRAAGDLAETIVPGRGAGPGAPAAPAWAEPRYPAAPPGGAGAGYGYPGPGPAAPASGPGPAAPPGGRPPGGAAPPGPGYGYPPPPAPSAGYGYRPPAAPGYTYPPPPVPAAVPGQGGAGRPSRTPKAWMILTAAVAIVAVIGGIVALVHHSPSSGSQSLSQIIKPDVTSCKGTISLGLTGLTHREFCRTDVSSIGLDAYQFATAADYTNGLARLNNITGWDPSGAGTGCPPSSGDSGGRTLWHSNVNASYPPRAGQVLECYRLEHGTRYLLYLWTLPTQRVILVANDSATGATFTDLERWWSGLSYG
jgi:hypothetical protein